MESNIKIIDMKETISKILYSKTAFMCFCGFTVAIIGFILYYAITGDWSGYSLLDNLPVYCMLAVYFLEFWNPDYCSALLLDNNSI